MADLASHNYTGNYSGLLSSFYLFLALGGICIVGNETLSRIPRKRAEERARKGKLDAMGGAGSGGAREGEDGRWKWRKKRRRVGIQGGDSERGSPSESHEMSEKVRASRVGDYGPLGIASTNGYIPGGRGAGTDRETGKARSAVDAADPTDEQELGLTSSNSGEALLPISSEHELIPASCSDSRMGPSMLSTSTSGASESTAIIDGSSVDRGNGNGMGSMISPKTVGGSRADGGNLDRAPTIRLVQPTTPTTASYDFDGADVHPLLPATGNSNPDSRDPGSAVHMLDLREKQEHGSRSAINDMFHKNELAQLRKTPSGRRSLVHRFLGSRESHEFGYMYQNRCWSASNPSEPLPRWPLGWIPLVWKLTELEILHRAGLDAMTHLRFLRGVVWFVALHLCTTMVVLLPLHLIYSNDEYGDGSMLKAGLSLTGDDREIKWLWVHVVLLYWLTITWIATLIWVIFGSMGYRKAIIAGTNAHLAKILDAQRTDRLPSRSIDSQGRSLVGRANLARQDVVDISQNAPGGGAGQGKTGGLGVDGDGIAGGVGQAVPQDHKGYITLEEPGFTRLRTLMVTNIPPDMRDEEILQAYFNRYLTQVDGAPSLASKVPHMVRKQFKRTQSLVSVNGITPDSAIQAVVGADPNVPMIEEEEQLVEEITMARKLGELGALRSRRADAIKRLEAAHVRLARRVLKAVEHLVDHANDRTLSPPPSSTRTPAHVGASFSGQSLEEAEAKAEENTTLLVRTLKPYTMKYRSDPLPDLPTVWDALLSLPTELLDPYQPLTGRLKRKQAPLMDYEMTRVRVLTARLKLRLQKPLETFLPASTAFITFVDTRTARRALSELAAHPLRPLTCITQWAPDWTDVMWPRVGKEIYRSQTLRGYLTSFIIWLFILFWIFPVSALVGIASVDTLATIFPPLYDYLTAHSSAANLFNTTIPVVLVALLSLAVCPVLLAVANHNCVTGYEVHNYVANRYWKFLMTNILVVFIVGKSAVQSYILLKETEDFADSILQQIASSFPAAAPFYASYLLLQSMIQCGFELFRLGLPIIFYVFSMRKAITPRARNQRLAFSTISWFFGLPNASFCSTLMLLFAVYNPLVLPFAFVYFSTAYLVWRRQFVWIYGRRYEGGMARNGIRYLRWTLDGLTLTHLSFLAFFVLAKKTPLAALSGVLMVLTVIFKIIATRIIKRRWSIINSREGEGIDRLRTGKEPAPRKKADYSFADRLWGKLRWMKAPIVALDRHFYFDPIVLERLDDPLLADGGLARGAKVGAKGGDLKETAQVQPFDYVEEWDDIPPPERMQPYTYQPFYSDGLDDFLWLPRDPFALDMGDTVKLGQALVTSQCPSGLISERLRRKAAAKEENLRPGMPGRPRLGSNASGIGAAVNDDHDLDDDPGINIFSRFGRKASGRIRRQRSMSAVARRPTTIGGRQPSGTKPDVDTLADNEEVERQIEADEEARVQKERARELRASEAEASNLVAEREHDVLRRPGALSRFALWRRQRKM